MNDDNQFTDVETKRLAKLIDGMSEEDIEALPDMIKKWRVAGMVMKIFWTVLLSISGALVALNVIFEKFRFWEHGK